MTDVNLTGGKGSAKPAPNPDPRTLKFTMVTQGPHNKTSAYLAFDGMKFQWAGDEYDLKGFYPQKGPHGLDAYGTAKAKGHKTVNMNPPLEKLKADVAEAQKAYLEKATAVSAEGTPEEKARAIAELQGLDAKLQQAQHLHRQQKLRTEATLLLQQMLRRLGL